jgi:alpha-tubulin suppressor-like RCC1 family protein
MPHVPNGSPAWRAVMGSTLLLASVVMPLGAQTVSVTLGDSARVVAPPGTRVAVPIRADLSLGAGLSLAAFQGQLRWPATRLQFDSLRAPSGWTATINQDSSAVGALVFSSFSPTALAASGPVATAYFTAAATNGGARLSLLPVAAGSEEARSLLAFVQPRGLDVCVGATGKWGDVTDDGTVNVIDAQQIARFSVGLTVGNPTVLAQRGDVTGDGTINVIDAQQVARFSVGLSANARINTGSVTIPTPSSLAMGTPSSPEVSVGSGVQLMAEPRDAAGASIAGCPTIAWSSSAPTVATVSATGLVTGVSPGTVTITATSGGQSATTTLAVRAVVANGPPVAVGGSFTCALSTEGQAYCWGLNSSYQLGDGTNEERLTPVPVSANLRFVALEATKGGTAACGLEVSGVAWCWGTNSQGQLGNGTTVNSPVPTRVLTDRRFTQLAAGNLHVCGIATDGESYCWGYNALGQIGNNSSANATQPTRVQSTSRFVRLEAGLNHSCGLLASGEAWCWGQNDYGQLGTGSTSDSQSRFLPMPVATTLRFTALTAGYYYTCGLTAAGMMYCWGLNSSGQLGDGTTTNQMTPTAVAGGPYASISAGTSSTCASASSGVTSCWGLNTSGQLGDGTRSNRFTPTAVSGTPTFLAVYPSSTHSCGIISAGTLHCWGVNTNGQLGDGSRSNLTTPAAVASPLAFSQLQAAGSTCGLIASGAAYCWGSNSVGQLGIGIDSTASVRWSPTPVVGGRAFATLASSGGAGTFCGVEQVTNALFCWGNNPQGQVGDGTTTNRSSPTAVSGGGAYRTVVAGLNHACAITTAGPLHCWGLNGSGQLGDGTTTNQSVPSAIALPQPLVALALGFSHSCGLTAAGAAYCWGSNTVGQLGDGSTTNRSAPTVVSGSFIFQSLAATGSQTCGLTTAGALYCWGGNGSGQLGDGTTTNRSVPTLVGTGPYAAVTLGSNHTCARTAIGAASCWGLNSSGQLGDGTVTNRLVPTPVLGGLSFSSITAGSNHSCGLTSSGAAYCWGLTSSGQTGVDLPLPIPRPVVSSVTFRRP